MAKLIDLNGLAYFYGKIKAMLAEKLGKNDTAAAAIKDDAGNTISTTYASKADVSALLNTKLGVTATAYAATRDGAGNNIVNTYAKKTDIPSAYTLPNATSSTLGGVKIGNNISVTNGTISLSQTDVTSALGYTPPTSDTVYDNATTTTAGLMSASDKVKLNSIAANANNYTHPSTHPASMITGLASVATSGSYSDLSNKPTIPVVPTNVSSFSNDAGYLTQHQSLDGYVKSVNGVTPNVAGDVTIAVGGGVSTDTTNTWTVKQTFSDIDVEFEYYKTEFQGSSSATPTESVLFCQTLGNFTLNLSNIVSKIPNGRSTVFSAYLSCFSDGVLTITNAGTLYYVGNASDLALTGTGLLVNILIIKNTSGAVDSVVQSSKLS